MKSGEQHTEVTQNQPARKKRRWRWLLWILLLWLLLPVFLVLVTQIPLVQQWGSQRIANYLSNQFNTEVSIKGFSLKWTDEIQLNSVLIRDLDRDTMIFVGELDANLDRPIRGFIDGKVKVEALALHNAFINIKFKKDDIQSNLDQVFKGPALAIDSARSQIQPELDIKKDKTQQLYFLDEFILDNVRVRNYHAVKGKEENFYAPNGRLSNAQINLSPLTIIADEVWFEGLEVDIESYEYDQKRYDELFIDPYIGDSTYVDLFPFTFTAKKAYISEAKLNLRNLRNAPVKLTAPDQLDWNHLEVSHIEIDGDSLYLKDWIFGGELSSLKAETSSGLNIVNADAKKIRVTEQLAVLDQFHLETSMSTIDGDLKFIYEKYPDFKDFANEVRFDMRLNNSEVGIDDLITFSPGLKNNPFFRENSDELISVNGRILGYINNLKGRSLNLRLGKKFTVDGLIDVRDFTDPDRTRINFDLQELSTDMKTIRELVPNLKLPDQFNKLGSLVLKGEFNGLLKDFIAFGDIQTDIGSAKFNMNLNFVNGVANAIYGGELDLNNFDLGNWTNNPEFGIVSLKTSISEGNGLTVNKARANLAASIQTFEFRGYDYKNAEFTGLLNDQLISGKFTIADDNIDLNWEGKIEIGKTPRIDVKGKLSHLDLQALRLGEKELVLKSDFNINIQDIDPDRFTGRILLANLGIGLVRDSLDVLDSLLITSSYALDSNKIFALSSSMVNGVVSGKFRILSLPNYFTNYFLEFNPKSANKLGLKPKESLADGDFNFMVDISNSYNFLSYVTDQIDTLKDVHLEGQITSGVGFELKANTPSLNIGTTNLTNFQLFAIADGAYANLVTSHDGMKVGKVTLSPLTIFADLEADTLFYVFNEIDFQTYFDQINVEGKLYVHEGLWQTQLFNSELQMFGEEWAISDNNFIRFGPQKLMVRNLDLSHGNEYIKVKSINNDRGLSIDLQDLPLGHLNDLIKYKKINFAGLLSGTIYTPSLKKLDEIQAKLTSPSLIINGDDFGEFLLTAKSDEPGAPIFVDLNLIKGDQRLLGLAEINVPNNSKGEEGSINSQLTIDHFPANILEYFITNGLSETTGHFHGSISAVGPLSDPVINGDINIPSSSFKIDILGTTYYLENQLVHLTSDLIDASGVVLTDRFGNRASVDGGITHHNLAKLGFDASMRSDKILVLETTKADNEIYYGKAYADIQARFGGSVTRPIIYVKAENKENSSFVINNDRDELSGGLDFIVFDFDTTAIATNNGDVVLGVDFTLDMSVNDGMEVQIILDESTRDIIRGAGKGDLIFRLNPAGEMSLFGGYAIDRGEYLFTYSVGGLVPVNKAFTIEKGSQLQWSGDPFEAEVDIKADYKVSAAPYNLIADQFGASEEARQKTDVNLRLLLTGPMLQPDIRFDLDFPELTGQLKSSVDIELARLRSDQTGMQNQATSLIIFRDFASSTVDPGSSVGVVANTISEWLSNQVSFYLTGFFSEIIANSEIIDDIEFDVGYRLPSGEYASAGSVTSTELGISTKLIMFNRRLEASLKGDYVSGSDVNTGASANYFNTDLVFDYMLTKDRRWRVRAYIKQDQFYTDQRTKGGLGLAWRREYDDLEEYTQAIKKINQERKAGKSR